MATTYSFTGSVQTHEVASDTDYIEATVRGAAGGDSDSNEGYYYYGGDGSEVTGGFSVDGGETLYIYVGERGQDGDLSASSGEEGGDGGWPTGGNGVYGSYSGSSSAAGGGGGHSGVRLDADTESARMIVAGGAGGAAGHVYDYDGSQYFYGGDALIPDGQDGGPDGTDDDPGGGGGTLDGPGNGPGDGTAGSGMNGGDGDDEFEGSGGGGGGGYYGGGGAESAGGGAGSTYTDSAVTIDSQSGGVITGAGEVVITEGTIDPPQNVSVDATRDSEIDLSWDSEDSADGYRIYRDTSSGVTTSDTLVDEVGSGTTSYTDTGLDNGKTYYYVVTSVTDYGKSDESNEASGTTTMPAPSSVSATVNADDDIGLSWTDEANATENFRVHINRDSITWTAPSGGPTTPTSTSVTYGPNSDNSYESQVGIDSSFTFRVRAEGSDANSDWSYSDTVCTSPIPPHDPSVGRPDANTFEISWTNQSDILSASNSLQIQYREDTGSGYGTWIFHDNTDADDGSYIVSTSHADFQENARYQFRLRGVNRSGSNAPTTSEFVFADYGNEGSVYFEDGFESGDISAWDSSYGGHTVEGGSHADTGVSGPDEGSCYLKGYGADDTESTWVQKNLGDLSNETDVLVKCVFAVGSLDGSAENFNIEWYDGSSWQVLAEWFWEYNEQGWCEVSTLVPDLWLSSDARIRVGDTTSSGMFDGDYWAVDRVVVSDLLHEYTSPAEPSDLTLDTTTDREITVSWTRNATFGDQSDLDSRETGASSWTDETNTASPYTITGLLDGEAYDVRTRSFVRQYRNGDYVFAWKSSYISDSATTNLPPVEDLTVDDVTGRYATLSWTDPSNNADGYRVLLDPDDDGGYSQDGNDISPVGEDETQSYETTELLDGQLYGATVESYTEHVTAREDQ
jgi:hypothetical protein